jgi:hypothetical protein
MRALSAGMHALHELVDELDKRGAKLVLANPSRTMQLELKRAKLLEHVGQVWVFVRTADAVAMCEQAINDETDNSNAVLMPLPPTAVANAVAASSE